MAEAARLLALSGLPLVPVCERDGRLVGVVTGRAILFAVAENPGLHDQLVDEMMDTDPVFVSHDASVEWVLLEMGDAGTWSVPVIDSDERLVGLLSLPDLVTAVFPALLVRTWNHIVSREHP